MYPDSLAPCRRTSAPSNPPPDRALLQGSCYPHRVIRHLSWTVVLLGGCGLLLDVDPPEVQPVDGGFVDSRTDDVIDPPGDAGDASDASDARQLPPSR